MANTMILTGTLQDLLFDGTLQTNTPNGFPVYGDIDVQNATGDDKAIAGSQGTSLGSDGTPVYSGGSGTATTFRGFEIITNNGQTEYVAPDANGNAVFAASLNQANALVANGTAGTALDWFNLSYHSAPDFNSSAVYSVRLAQIGSSDVYRYSNTQFFPFNDLTQSAFVSKLQDQGVTSNGTSEDFGFSYQLHDSFTYNGDENLEYSSEDDMYVYINGKLALNLGGVHSPESGNINLDLSTATGQQEAQALGLTIGQTYDFDMFTQQRHTDGSVLSFDVPVCFNSGTHIRTTQGEVAVEHLVVGDLVVTAAGSHRPVRWLSNRTIDCRNHPRSHDAMPIRVAAHAFGADLPQRDLFLSPGHPVLVGADDDSSGGHLVPIMCLINGTTIRRVPVDTVTYWHVELDVHDILLAEGLPAESYIDLGSRPWFAGAEGALFDPDMALPGMPGRCRPVAIDGPVVEVARRQLDAAFALRLTDACVWPTNDADAVAF